MSAPELTGHQRRLIDMARRDIAAYRAAFPRDDTIPPGIAAFWEHLGKEPGSEDSAMGEALGWMAQGLMSLLEVVDELTGREDQANADEASRRAGLDSRRTLPGHPTEAGAGYECHCGDCLSLPARGGLADDPGPAKAERCPETSDGYHCTGWQEGAHRCCACGLSPDGAVDEDDEDPLTRQEYGPGPEVDDEGGMSEYRHMMPEDGAP